MLDSSNSGLHIFLYVLHLNLFVMICSSLVPSGCRLVGGGSVPDHREDNPFLVTVVFLIKEWPYKEAACACLLTPNRA